MKKRTMLFAALTVIASLAVAGGSWWGRGGEELTASGTLEARNVGVGSKIGGRITQVLAAEGDRVEANQLLLTFDDAELAAKMLQARGRVEQARATLKKLQRGSRPEDIAEAQAAAELPDGSQGYRGEEIAQQRFDLERARAEAVNAQRAFQRAQELARQGVVSAQFRDDAEARMQMAVAQARSLEHAVNAAEGRLRAATAVQERAEKGSRKEDIEFARADLTRAEGELQEAEARWKEREVRAPVRSVVEVMDVRPGDLVAANARIAKLLEADQLYVMVYVPQTRIGGVRIGQGAKVRVDSYPGETFNARVEQIRQQAEFLPRNVQTKEERVHQVIGVKLRVDNAANKLRAGINADVTFGAEGR